MVFEKTLEKWKRIKDLKIALNGTKCSGGFL